MVAIAESVALDEAIKSFAGIIEHAAMVNSTKFARYRQEYAGLAIPQTAAELVAAIGRCQRSIGAASTIFDGMQLETLLNVWNGVQRRRHDAELVSIRHQHELACIDQLLGTFRDMHLKMQEILENSQSILQVLERKIAPIIAVPNI